MIQSRVDTVRRATVHVQNEGSEGDPVYECSKRECEIISVKLIFL